MKQRTFSQLLPILTLLFLLLSLSPIPIKSFSPPNQLPNSIMVPTSSNRSPGIIKAYQPATYGNRTPGTPVIGFWNQTHGSGALPSAISPTLRQTTSPAPAGVPNSFSWNGYFGGSSYMTSIKDQGTCGSCWAFASVGAMEGQYQIGISNPNLNLDLSEQNLLSCSGGSCSGYYLDSTLNFLRDSGTPDEACYPYVGAQTSCGSGRCSNYQSRIYKITGWNWIDTSTANIKNYIYTHGPIIVWMPIFSDFPWYDANFWQTHFYSHSPNGTYAGHAVVIVGWNDQGAGTADDYWIVRNSWGTSGGDVNDGYGGYFYITQDPTTGFFGIYQEAAVISGVVPPLTTTVTVYSTSYSFITTVTPATTIIAVTNYTGTSYSTSTRVEYTTITSTPQITRTVTSTILLTNTQTVSSTRISTVTNYTSTVITTSPTMIRTTVTRVTGSSTTSSTYASSFTSSTATTSTSSSTASSMTTTAATTVTTRSKACKENCSPNPTGSLFNSVAALYPWLLFLGLSMMLPSFWSLEIDWKEVRRKN